MGCRCEALGEREGTSERGLTRIFRAKRRLVSRAFMTLAEGRTGEQEKHRPRCVGGGGADGSRAAAADLAGGFIPVTRPEFRCSPFFYVPRPCFRRSSVSAVPPFRPDPLYFSFSRGEIAFTRLHSVSFPVRLLRLLRPPSTQFPAGEEKVTMRKI